MLEKIRQKKNSTIIMLAFGIIILVFVFWGVGPSGDNVSDPAVVATVDGEAISAKEYAGLYKRQLEYFKNTMKGQLDDEMIKKLDLRRRAVDILINRSLALKAAKDEGIKATEEEIQEAIKGIPAFSKNGAFDKETYFATLSANRLTPPEFEKSVEKDITTGKVRDKVVKDVKVSEEEIKKEFSREFRKYSFSFIAVDGAELTKGAKVTDEEGQEYLKKNASAFMIPAKMKAVYAFAYFDELAKGVKVGDDEIKSYYESNKKQFEMPDAVKARHILLMPDAKATDKAKAREEAKKKAEDILGRLKKGGDFAELAKAHSQDPGSGRQGGDLGWFQRGVMVKPFEEAAFSLKKGETSGLVETEFGYHIIRVEDKREGGVASLKDATPSIKRAISQAKARNTALETFQGLERSLSAAKSNDDIKMAFSSAKGVKSAVTGLFAESDKTVELARNDVLREAAFSLKAGEVSKPIETPEGVYIIKALERSEPRTPDFRDVAATVKARVAMDKGAEAASNKAKELLKRLSSGEDFKAVAKAEGLKVDDTGLFSKSQGFIPKIGAFSGDKEKLFEVTEAAPYFGEPVEHNGKYYILRLSSVKDPDEAQYAGLKDQFSARILQKKQDEALNNWLKGLREKAKIQVFEDKL